jgi:hypothetical protein
VVLTHAGEPVNNFFDGPENWVQESFLPVEDAGHENPQRLGNKKNHQQEERDL